MRSFKLRSISLGAIPFEAIAFYAFFVLFLSVASATGWYIGNDLAIETYIINIVRSAAITSSEYERQQLEGFRNMISNMVIRAGLSGMLCSLPQTIPLSMIFKNFSASWIKANIIGSTVGMILWQWTFSTPEVGLLIWILSVATAHCYILVSKIRSSRSLGYVLIGFWLLILFFGLIAAHIAVSNILSPTPHYDWAFGGFVYGSTLGLSILGICIIQDTKWFQ